MTPDAGTLLGVWAHPDDEAYLSAGLMVQARRAGRRVVVVTATRGEHGTEDPLSWPPERLARLRERELVESLRVVGVEEHSWLGHADGSLAETDRRPAVATLQRLIEDLSPDTIVTFGPDGMTGHSDHRAVSSWTTEAWQRSGGSAALWYATLTPAFHATWGALNDRIGLWSDDVEPPVTPEDALAAQIVCAGELGQLKQEALRAHASQTRPLEDLVGTETYRSWWAVESFVAADRSGAAVTRSSGTAARGRPGSWSGDLRVRRPPASA